MLLLPFPSVQLLEKTRVCQHSPLCTFSLPILTLQSSAIRFSPQPKHGAGQAPEALLVAPGLSSPDLTPPCQAANTMNSAVPSKTHSSTGSWQHFFWFTTLPKTATSQILLMASFPLPDSLHVRVSWDSLLHLLVVLTYHFLLDTAPLQLSPCLAYCSLLKGSHPMAVSHAFLDGQYLFILSSLS